MSVRPLVRWTVGNTNKLGMDCLGRSVRAWRRLYREQFDMAICHNNMTERQLAELLKLDVELIDQHGFTDRLTLKPPRRRNPCWKLYPPRLRPDAHEIIIDNDVLLRRHLPAVEELLVRNQMFVTEGIFRSYGQFEAVVPDNIKINTGMYGLPPGYDLGGKVNGVLKSGLIQKWEGHLDEQGLLASVFAKDGAKMARLSDISVLDPRLPYGMGKCGAHFVGLNNGYSDRWLNYLSLNLL